MMKTTINLVSGQNSMLRAMRVFIVDIDCCRNPWKQSRVYIVQAITAEHLVQIHYHITRFSSQANAIDNNTTAEILEMISLECTFIII